MDNLNLNIINDNKYIIPKFKNLLKCFQLVASYHNIKSSYVNIKIISNSAIQKINKDFRNNDNPTNIISFKFDPPPGLTNKIAHEFLGDIAIAPEILEIEAIQQNKNIDQHWYHIFIHGLLHLLDYNHIDSNEAYTMENLEIKFLKELNISNPYLDIEYSI